MRRFILIDNWLESVGGHNYQYAMEILQAAANSQHEVVLATAQAFFKERSALPTNWSCYPIFRYAWNRTHTVGVDGKRTEPVGIDGRTLNNLNSSEQRQPSKGKPWSRFFQTWDRKRRIRAFKDACQHLFDRIGWNQDDIIFFPSVSDFDFLGLAAFLASNNATKTQHWHVQFHYDIFDGRPPEFESQRERIACMSRQFSHALAAIPTHRLHFYATTQQIADQYNRLQVAKFSPLPYPISLIQDFEIPSRPPRDKRLRVTLAGAPRREKGKRELNQLFERLHRDHTLEQNAQVWMQGNHHTIARQLSDFDQTQIARAKTPASNDAPIVVVPHPLKRKEYLEFIHHTDIGLLPYNNARYHARASGVLIEMLSAGVPVIVTAGSWLALQLAEPIYQHLEGILRREAIIAKKYLETPLCNADDNLRDPNASGKPESVLIAGDTNPTTTSIAIPAGAGAAIVQIPWLDTRPGHFLRVRAVQQDATGRTQARPHSSILCEREQGKSVFSIVGIDPQSDSIRIEISNAYHNHSMMTGRPQISFIKRSAKELPSGAVGLIASDFDQIPDLIREMILHYGHYRESAREHAHSWNHEHAPLRTIERLIEKQSNDSVLRGVA
ncbi:MAG: hypothetical protein VYA11_08705 [Planctomycetota bacterium]|nr:hypothetical protein [Planctomycetota bacterium]